jgi:hypothetical protein
MFLNLEILGTEKKTIVAAAKLSDTKRRVRVMAFNVTFNNISVISILLVEETGVPGENH